MTDEQVDRWQAALRSGTHKQCRSSWREHNTSCCLDVLLKVEGRIRQTGYSRAETKKAGMTDDAMDRFTEANDLELLNFTEIADLVEFMRDELTGRA